MKHKLSACILIPTLAGYSTAKVGIKLHALSFISAACFSAFYRSPTNTEKFQFFFLDLFVYFFYLCNRIAMDAQ